MQVRSPLQATRRRARVAPMALPAQALPGGSPRLAPAAPPVAIPGTWNNPSRVNGEWTPDVMRAQYDAQNALSSIDWSKRDIVIYVPGTSNHAVHPEFDKAVRSSWSDGGVSLVRMEYEATWNMRPSVATGLATLKLILAGIAAHGGDHRVMLAGESQGAWIIGEAAADPMLRPIISRAVMLGHPFVAAHHYDDGHDPDIAEINHRGDQVAAGIKGDVSNAFDAMLAIRQLHVWELPSVVKAVAQNPIHGWMLLMTAVRAIPGAKLLLRDPHDYSKQMTGAVEFLRSGRFNDGRDARLRNYVIDDPVAA